MSKVGAMLEDRWAFVIDYVTLKNHFGDRAIIMLARELGIRLTDEMLAAVNTWSDSAEKLSFARKDPDYQWLVSTKKKKLKLQRQELKSTAQRFGCAMYTGAELADKNSKKAQKSAVVAAAEARTQQGLGWYCSICSKHYKWLPTCQDKIDGHCVTKGHQTALTKHKSK